MDNHDVKAVVKQKFRIGENIITTFDAYQIVGAEHQNRLLVIVNFQDTNALFAFSVHNSPITSISDLTISHLWEINKDFRIEENQSSGISSHQFKIYNNENCQTYYYYPDEATIGSKDIFQHFLRQIIECCCETSSYQWLDHYKTDDYAAIISPNLADGTKMASFKTRESKFRDELERRRKEYTTFEGRTIYVATWNVNNYLPDDIFLREWLANTETAPDIYAIGFQEIDMSPQCIITNEQRPDRSWVDKIMRGLHPAGRYMELKTLRLVGMMLTVVIKSSLRPAVKSCAWDMVGTGPMSMGNKGGLGISLIINEASICFINSHLAAHLAEVERRNEDHDEIIRRMQFVDAIGRRSIDDHQHIFWLGDLNYRLTLDKDTIKIRSDYEFLYKYDQLFVEKTKNRIFKNYTEGSIKFKPTYKYDVGTDTYDSSEKARAPAFTDRILYKGQRIEQKKYDCVMTLRQSDHKPIYSVFDVQLQKQDEEKYKRVHEEVLKFVDKYENDNQPIITVEQTDIDFGVIKFNECFSRELLVANNCHLPVKFLFTGKDGSASQISESWIKISQTQGSLITGQSLRIQIDILIDRKAVAQVLHKIRDYSSGDKIPLDILVLHVVNGRDIFITIFGEFKPSCFGLSMEALTKLVKPVTQYDLKELMEIERDRDQENLIQISNPMVVPREIWKLIDYLYRNGLNTPNLFTHSRKYSINPNINEIRDWLDTWSESPFPGTPHTAAEALLFLLEAPPEPIVSISARECSVNCDNFERCRDLILRQKPAKRKIFLYICLFLRELQKYYTTNRMDDQFLANLFGRIMIREPLVLFPSPPVNPANNIYGFTDERTRKFMLNFLVNDIVAFARNELKK